MDSWWLDNPLISILETQSLDYQPPCYHQPPNHPPPKKKKHMPHFFSTHFFTPQWVTIWLINGGYYITTCQLGWSSKHPPFLQVLETQSFGKDSTYHRLQVVSSHHSTSSQKTPGRSMDGWMSCWKLHKTTRWLWLLLFIVVVVVVVVVVHYHCFNVCNLFVVCWIVVLFACLSLGFFVCL